MIEKLQSIIRKHEELRNASISPEVIWNQKESVRINRELSKLQEQYELSLEYIKYNNQLFEAKSILDEESEEEMIEMAKEQRKEAELQLYEIWEKYFFGD